VIKEEEGKTGYPPERWRAKRLVPGQDVPKRRSLPSRALRKCKRAKSAIAGAVATCGRPICLYCGISERAIENYGFVPGRKWDDQGDSSSRRIG